MWFYASVNGKRPTKTSLFDNFLEAFFPQHKKSALSKTDARKIVTTIRQMQQEIAICRKLIEGEWPFPHAQPIKQWDRDRLNLLINALDHTLCMPLLLAAAVADIPHRSGSLSSVCALRLRCDHRTLAPENYAPRREAPKYYVAPAALSSR